MKNVLPDSRGRPDRYEILSDIKSTTLLTNNNTNTGSTLYNNLCANKTAKIILLFFAKV